MKAKIITLVLTTLVLFGLSGKSIAGNEAKWKASFTKEIKWMKVTDVGTVVVCTEDGLYGVNQKDGTIIWKDETLKKMVVEAYDPVPGTPYIMISPEALPAEKAATTVKFNKGYVIIMNALDGVVSCNTKTMGMRKLLNIINLKELNAVIFVGMGEKKFTTQTIYMDLNTNTKVWENASFIAGDPKVVNKDCFLTLTSEGYALTSTKTGEVIFKKPIKFKSEDSPQLIFNSDRTIVYIITKRSGNAYKVADGTSLWATPIDMDEPAS